MDLSVGTTGRVHYLLLAKVRRLIGRVGIFVTLFSYDQGCLITPIRLCL